MPKPTLSIGGTITPAEATELADLLLALGCPMAGEEGDERPSYPGEEASSYLACIRDASANGAPLGIGSWERNDNLLHDAERAGVLDWLREREKRLTWRYFEPSGATEDGEPYNGRVEVHGAGVDEVLDVETCVIDVNDRPIVHVRNLSGSPLTAEQLLTAAGIAHRIFIHPVPPLRVFE